MNNAGVTPTVENAAYMEALIDDPKRTYQLENGCFVPEVEQNLIRFWKELRRIFSSSPRNMKNRAIDFERQ